MKFSSVKFALSISQVLAVTRGEDPVKMYLELSYGGCTMETLLMLSIGSVFSPSEA